MNRPNQPNRKRKKFSKVDNDGNDDKNIRWVTELDKKMNNDFQLQPIYSMVQRHHIFPSVKGDYCQVTVQYGNLDRMHMMKRGVDYRSAQNKVAKSACNKLKSIKGGYHKGKYKDANKPNIGQKWCPKCKVGRKTVNGKFCNKCGCKLEENEDRVSVPNISGAKLTHDGLPSLSTMGNDALEVVHECGKYISGNVLATLFKDMLHYISTQVNGVDYEYKTELQQGGFVGYTSVLIYNWKKNFQSLGVMIDENQAEQSAAEVCLREQGFLPDVAKDEYTIQPYRGGLPHHVEGIQIDQPCAFTSNLLSDVLEAFCFCYHLGKPQYYGKDVETDLTIVPLTSSFKPEKIIDCVCLIGGKSFHSPFPHIERIARQFTANSALQHYGVSRLKESMELRKHININKYDFKHACVTIRIDHRPSLRKGWLHPRFFRPQSYGEAGAQDFISCGMLKYIFETCRNMKKIVNIKLFRDKTEYVDNLVRAEMSSAPAFRGEPLSELTDISVAEIDSNNPNLFVIGNSRFSIKMLCDDGKIFCNKQRASIKVLPGHNIQKLRCEYRLSLPSLEIHLKAVECEDLNYITPPLPVVTSCGVVVLYHDLEASPEDVLVLVTQRVSGISFESKVCEFVKLFRGLLKPWGSLETSPQACTKGIRKWLYEEVKLLSEMTVSSVSTLLSTFCKYDVQWNKFFIVNRLPRPLQDIQDICRNELKRRERNDLSEEDKSAEVWELPQSEFVTSFDTLGIHLEDGIFCARRGLVESAGVKLPPDIIEDIAMVDIPAKSDKQHRGDLSRYYIWSEIYEGKIPNIRHKEMLKKGYTKYGDLKWLTFDHGRAQYVYKFAKTIDDLENHLLRNIQYLNADGSRTPYVNQKQETKPTQKKKEEEDEVSDSSEEELGEIGDNEDECEGVNMMEDRFRSVNQRANDQDVPIDDEAEIEKYHREKKARYDDNKKFEEERIKRGGDELLARDAFRQHCVWKKLDEAVNMCPALLKVAQTSQFLDQLRTLIEDANNLMKQKDLNKTVKLSLLLTLKLKVEQ